MKSVSSGFFNAGADSFTGAAAMPPQSTVSVFEVNAVIPYVDSARTCVATYSYTLSVLLSMKSDTLPFVNVFQ